MSQTDEIEETDEREIALMYRTLADQPRVGPLGAIARAIAANPLGAGAAGGVATIVIAAIARPGGPQSAPLVAGALSTIVLATWVTLLWVTRGLFEQLRTQRVEVVRELLLTDDAFAWGTIGGVIERELDAPSLTLFAAPGAEDVPSERPWPVWLVIEAKKGKWVLESKLMAKEARELELADARLFEERDEILPTHVASPLLRRAMES